MTIGMAEIVTKKETCAAYTEILSSKISWKNFSRNRFSFFIGHLCHNIN